MNKHKLKALILMVGAIFMAFLMVNINSQAATTRYQGVDWSKYQGTNGIFGYSTDKFVFSQAGGFYGGTNIPQTTYDTQVASAKKAGKWVHTYLWDGVGSNMTNAKAMMTYYLPRIKTPKGSIVALDYEDGASTSVTANTNAILAQMKLIKDAGFTPMLYSGKAYLNAHVNVTAILKAYPTSLWVASYADYLVAPKPDYNWFPSMDGVAIWQYTSMYIAGGLDGNVDLTGITKSGYTTTAKTTTAAKKTTTTTKASNQTYSQNGTFYPNTTLNVRSGAGTSYSKVATYYSGESVRYNQVIIKSDYVWARYLRSNGHYGYVALGVNGGTSYGKRVLN
ncbi:GH25 family lysozyme [Lactiplantibacillus fabifermentans]|uniref:Prophage lp1 protein 58, lysin n=1 Tax=Lactiplantibacillus fabifermentans DSM 21115 TaxID=1413187 RepID=A0A0R2P0J1_9LACO|nr:GH25 family lysozyme [Lactiplantibacillus fabifermentans]KRO28474.1 prophage lp1 protein 58, lysin [Lactiplantibacillus fabifermentans DSM 21115]